jgi:putative copper export protein
MATRPRAATASTRCNRRAVDEALVLCRLLQFQSALAPGTLARALNRPLLRVSRAAILVVFVTTVGWLLLAGGEMGDGWVDTWNPATISSVLFFTEFGQVWLWRSDFAVILLSVLALVATIAGRSSLCWPRWSSAAWASSAMPSCGREPSAGSID